MGQNLERNADPVQKLVGRVRARMFIRGWIGWTLRCLFIASVASLVWFVTARLCPEIGELVWAIVLLLLAVYRVGL